MKDSKIYDYSVSLVRITAMIFIVVCHLTSYFGKTAFAQLFNVGVPLFYLISGYLYANKKIEDERKWIKRKFINLYIPVVLWLLIETIFRVANRMDLFPWYEYIVTLFNLQGITFVFTFLPVKFHAPWFLTTIMLCYIFLIFIKRDENEIRGGMLSKACITKGGMIPLGVFIALRIILNIDISCFWIFYIGYYIGKERKVDTYKANGLISLCVIILSTAIRLIAKHFLDDTVLYLTIASITHACLAAGIFIFVKWLSFLFPTLISGIGKLRVISILDSISLYVYVCHSWFYEGPIFYAFSYNLNFVLELLIYLSLVFIMSYMYRLICKCAEKCIRT